MKQLTKLIATLATFILAVNLAYAEGPTPLAISNQSPLIQLYGLPPAPTELAPAGRWASELTLNVSSNFQDNDDNDEFIWLDGETYRYELTLRYGIQENLNLGVTIPYLQHRNGFLDSFIEDWHDTFGLPQGGRDKYPQNQLHYQYSKDGQTVLLLDEPAEGLGDIRLSACYRPWQDDSNTLLVQLSLELPTGDSDKLLGSGSYDLALAGQLRHLGAWFNRPLSVYGGLGVLAMSDGDILEDQQRPLVVFGHCGVGWQAWQPVALKLQLDGHSSFYNDSDLREVNSPSLQLAMGGSINVGTEDTLDLAVTEDVMVDTAPDVVFHIGWRHLF